VTTRERVLWGAAAAGAFFAAFPHPVAGSVVDGGAFFAWVAPALLIGALRDLPPCRAALFGLGITWVAYAAILHWIYVVTVSYGHAHPAIGVLAPIALAAYIAVFGALFGAGHAWFATRGLASAWSAALLWTALDHLRSFALTGFPWATLGYAQHGNPAMLGLASFTGVYGLSFVSVLGSAALLETFLALRAGRRPPHAVLGAFAAVVALHGLGLLAPRAAGPESIRIGVIQGNIDQGVKWNAAWIEQTLERYEALSRDAADAGAELVVWPETAVPGGLEVDPVLRARVASLARETGAAFVVGGVGMSLDETGRPSAYFDSAFHFDANGRLLDRYDKTHLVPFGEYIPRGLRPFLTAVARGIARVGVEAGEAPRVMEVALPDGRSIRLGVPVCYELLFPDLVRRFAADGGQALLGITNDAWYGRTGAPYQFLAITALRAAETGLPVARAANTGVSGFIDGGGEVLEAAPIFE
jgi:apolipoprotein N-acyltransferase